MASVSASHLILFIASMVIAAGVAGTFTNSVDRLSDAIGEQGLDVTSEVRTDVEVISDSGSQVYDGTNVSLLVKNTGSERLAAQPSQVDVILDGTYRADVSVSVLGTSPSWGPGEVVEVNVTDPGLPTGDHRVKLVVNEDEEVFEFRT